MINKNYFDLSFMKNFTGSLLHTAWTEEEKLQLDQTMAFVEEYKGADFLTAACQHLYQILRIDFIQIGSSEQQNLKYITTVVRLLYGQVTPNTTYYLSNTPFNQIFSEEFIYFPFGLSALYPDYKVINNVPAESYLSMPLLNASGKPLGVIILLHSRLIERAGYVEALLNALAPRIEVELSSTAKSKFNQVEKSCTI